jgi:PelA/Pel-15E family pectate lyase
MFRSLNGMMTQRSIRRQLGAAILICALAFAGNAQNLTPAHVKPISWDDVLKQENAWYGGVEAIRIADNVLLYQRNTGGWPKNIDMAATLSESKAAAVAKQKQGIDSNIDNGATYTQLIFLARVYEAKKLERHKESFLKGLDYLLKAQYPNGGWPQYFPNSKRYYAHITFNDGAMIGVLKILRDIAQDKSVYGFVDEGRRSQARDALQKGIDCILKTQVVVNGQRTVWAAQHDEITLAPAPARAFEPVALASAESVGVVRFLMSLSKPNQGIIDAVESAVKWFETSKIAGIKWIEKADTAKPGNFQRVAVHDKNAEPIWARFYEIGTNRGIFIGRDGIIKYSVGEIDEERRNGYQWYVDTPNQLLSKDYPSWLKKRAH